MIVAAILYIVAGMMLYESKIESVVMDKKRNAFLLERYPIFGCSSKFTRLDLQQICKVHAIHKGFTGESFYVLVVTFQTGVQVKILQTRNTLRIKKYVSPYLNRRLF